MCSVFGRSYHTGTLLSTVIVSLDLKAVFNPVDRAGQWRRVTMKCVAGKLILFIQSLCEQMRTGPSLW